MGFYRGMSKGFQKFRRKCDGAYSGTLLNTKQKKIWYAMGDGQKKTLLISNVWGTVRKVIDSNIDLNIVSDFKCMMIFNDYE